MELVFVYGTLKKGYGNHGFLENSKFLGEFVTKLPSYELISLKGANFPALVEVPSNGFYISGEVYEVDYYTLAELDRLESNGQLYERKEIELLGFETQTPWAYFIMPHYIPFIKTNTDSKRIKTNKMIQVWNDLQ